MSDIPKHNDSAHHTEKSEKSDSTGISNAVTTHLDDYKKSKTEAAAPTRSDSQLKSLDFGMDDIYASRSNANSAPSSGKFGLNGVETTPTPSAMDQQKSPGQQTEPFGKLEHSQSVAPKKDSEYGSLNKDAFPPKPATAAKEPDAKAVPVDPVGFGISEADSEKHQAIATALGGIWPKKMETVDCTAKVVVPIEISPADNLTKRKSVDMI